MALILLRHQPGVDVLEYRLQDQGWSETVEEWIHDKAEELFGISEYDIGDDISEDHFEPKFEMMRDESDAYWASHGWDITDGKGKELLVMEFLTRPMVCMVEKLHPDAKFTGADQAWARSLEEEAKNFKPRR